MPTVVRPFVLPPCIKFCCNDESSLTQRVTVYNPYTFDILYKVDNARPQKYNISIRQGVVSSRQKLYLDVACRHREPSQDDTIRVRFFKWPRPCHGVKPRTQQYIGFREIKLHVYDEWSEREKTTSQSSDLDMPAGAASSITSSQGMSSCGSSRNISYQQQQLDTGDCVIINKRHHRSQKLQVLLNLGVTVVLLILGFLLNKTDDAWFSANVLEGIKPHTIAIVFYTLACILLMKLLTFR